MANKKLKAVKEKNIKNSKSSDLTPVEREKLFNELQGIETNAAVNASFEGARDIGQS